jgi:archaemetzincin
LRAPVVALVPAGPLDPGLLRCTAPALAAATGLRVLEDDGLEIHGSWIAPGADAIRSEPLIHALIERRTRGRLLLAMTDAPLHAEGIGPIFGEAAIDERCAAISLRPLRTGSGSIDVVLLDRIVTSALHELGHLAGADHCRRASCVMFPSLDIADTDRKGRGFCADCRRAVQWPAHRQG